MNKESSDSSLPPHPAVTAETFKVFLPGQRVYLQATVGHAPLIALAELVTALPSESRVQLRWLATTALDGGAPDEGQLVRLSTGEKRILYVVEGRVITLHSGVLTSAIVEVPGQCPGYNRRRHPRYELTASAKAGPDAEHFAFAPASPVSIDLSLGGFGLRLPDPGWPVGLHIFYELEVQSGQTGSGLSAVPAIRLQGAAVIRRRVEQANGVILLGCEFEDLSGYRASVLEFWLDTFNVYLRER
jgi:hypothetical protein